MNTKEKVMNKLKGKEAYTLNLTDGLNHRIIENAEKIIAQLEASKERMFPTYEEKRIYFEAVQSEWLEVKQQWDNLDNEIKEQRILIQTMQSFRKSEAKEKKLKVIKEKEEHEGTPAPKRISWLDEAAKVLEAERRWMTPEAIAERIFKSPQVIEQSKLLRSREGQTKYMCIAGLIKHANITASGEKRNSPFFKPVLTEYHNLIGMYDWTGDNNIPKPEFIAQFMHKH